MTLFLHAADLHLDTPVSGVRGYPPEVAAALRDASVEAWDALVSEAIGRDVSLVLLAGDLYDGAERGVRAQRRFRAGLERLGAAGVRTFVVHGNHDPVEEGWSAIDRFPPGVHVFGTEVEAVTVDTDDGPVTVHGISYATRHTTENLVHRFGRVAGRPGVHIGLVHATVGRPSGHEPYSPCTLADLAAVGVDYWALGHIHTRDVRRVEGGWVAYPGNLQGRNPRPAEQGPKGALVGTIRAGRIPEPGFVALDRIRFTTVTVDLDDEGAPASVTALCDTLVDLASPVAHGGRSVVVQAVIRGGSGPADDLRRVERREEVLEALRSDAPANPFVWWDRISWDLHRRIDLTDAAGRPGFVGDLLRRADDPELAARRAELVGELPADVRRLLGARAPDPTDDGLWEKARDRALELVAEAGR